MVRRAGGGVNVLLTGDIALDATFRSLPRKLQRTLTRKATRKAAKEVVLPAAKDGVPVDTGDLDESLVVRSAKVRGAIGHAVVTRDGFFKGDEFYGGFIEFGWEDKPEGDPFLRPALYGNEHRIKAIFRAALRSFIRLAGRTAVKPRRKAAIP